MEKRFITEEEAQTLDKRFVYWNVSYSLAESLRLVHCTPILSSLETVDR